jgi:murein L,D-transpeptidase YcbB/YkuD
VLALAVSIGATACDPTAGPRLGVAYLGVLLSESGVPSAPSGISINEAIAALVYGPAPKSLNLTSAEQTELRRLYQKANEPLWIDAAGRPSQRAVEGVALLGGAADEGLDPADYHEALLRGLAAQLGTGSAGVDQRALFDVALSGGLLRYLRHLHYGRVNPTVIGVHLPVPADRHDFAAILRAAIDHERIGQAAGDLRPPLAQYRHLRAMLARYRSLRDDTTWTVPGAFTRAIHDGDAYAWSDVVGRQLVALGDMSANARDPDMSGRYEGTLVEGVKRFQMRHGLEPDGVLGRSTIAALRVPIFWRVRQIELALERLRWLPRIGENRLIVLNIPMFRLWAWEAIPPHGEALFGMNAIVGRADGAPTPVLVSEMREIIFRPYWNVPRSILLHEILPRLQRDPDYLTREAMEIVDGESDMARPVPVTRASLMRLRQGQLRLRQRPGAWNALGLIKFVFPNQSDVYMHGTPYQALFARNRRDFSHGCVRVEDPVSLAEWILKDQHEWSREHIVAATSGTQTIHVKLVRPVQVILSYTTAAVVPEDERVWFADDIYGHDARLDRALASRGPEDHF